MEPHSAPQPLRREQLLAAAVLRFAQDLFHRVDVESMARAAGVGKESVGLGHLAGFIAPSGPDCSELSCTCPQVALRNLQKTGLDWDANPIQGPSPTDSQGRLYRYVKGKDDLFLATVEYQLEDALGCVQRLAASEPEATAYLRAVIHGAVDTFLARPEAFVWCCLRTNPDKGTWRPWWSALEPRWVAHPFCKPWCVSHNWLPAGATSFPTCCC